jgi:uncharacterized protein
MIELIIYGFVVGLSLGLSGGGGSILAVPLLVYGAGVPVHQALIISLIVVGTSAFVGALQRIKKSEVDFRAALVMILTSFIFAPCGAIISQRLPGRLIMIGFATLMFVVGVSMWIKAVREESNIKKEAHAKHPLVLICGGAITSFLNGLFGVGGGFLIVPTLVFAASLNIKRAMATSLLVIACISLVSTLTHFLNEKSLELSTTTFFLIGGVVGVTAGVRVAKNIKDHHLHKGFSIMIILIGILVLIEEFIP